MAICLNPELDYVLLQVPNGEVYILAEDLAESVMQGRAASTTPARSLATLKGSEFELMTATHPFFDRDLRHPLRRPRHPGRRHRLRPHRPRLRRWTTSMICQRYDEACLTDIGMPVPVNAKGVMTDEQVQAASSTPRPTT